MTVNIAATIRNRRTIHQFKSDEIPSQDLIEEALEVAVWAPNHHLSQPWQFHLLGAQSKEQICLLNSRLVAEKKGEKMAALKLARWREIPGWLVISNKRDENELKRREDYAACCCVAQNLALLLWEQGIGMKWTTGAVTRDPRFFELLELDTQCHEIVGLFWYGYPEDVPVTRRLPSSAFLRSLP